MVLTSENPVPDELFDLIIAYFVDDRETLHALLLSSRRLFLRTVPILYKSPFQLIEHSRQWNREEKDKRSALLLALLLTSRRREIAIQSAAVATTTMLTTATTTPSSLTAGHVHHPQLPRYPYRHQQSFLTATTDYLRFYTDQHNISLLRPLVTLRSMASESKTYILDESRSMTDLQTDVAISLNMYRSEKVKVIGQPIARIPLIVHYLPKLKSLVRLELSEIPYDCQIEPTIEFIRVHDACHNTLREIKIKGNDDSTHQQYPGHTNLIRIVQAMREPEVVDARHWREATDVLDQIPVDSLRTLLLALSDTPPINISVPEYLARCGKLERLRMRISDKGLFAWATAEARISMNQDHQRALSRSLLLPTSRLHHTSSSSSLSSSYLSTPPTSASWQYHHHHFYDEEPEPWLQGPPPIKSLELVGDDKSLLSAVQDAVDAFRDTLKDLKAVSMAVTMEYEPEFNIKPLTWSWPMSQLTVLDLEGEIALSFEFSALGFCPMLRTLRLSLPPYMYSTSENGDQLNDMKARIPMICLATSLMDLELYGKWTVSDALLGKMVKAMARLTNLYIVDCVEYTMGGVLEVINKSKLLASLAISKWLCIRQPNQQLLQDVRTKYPHIELVEA
ncbi:hypothetical protein BG011_006486 [Mortierella polycephala]|uniref:Uncharacterized protein n=1 Tax=Mortierella polycephala TaxID=41804 RepID=A0A9P6TZY5_9FUNG|nr:hypothetical protein BG011_006486 [Mortierella polycephala]